MSGAMSFLLRCSSVGGKRKDLTLDLVLDLVRIVEI